MSFEEVERVEDMQSGGIFDPVPLGSRFGFFVGPDPSRRRGP